MYLLVNTIGFPHFFLCYFYFVLLTLFQALQANMGSLDLLGCGHVSLQGPNLELLICVR